MLSYPCDKGHHDVCNGIIPKVGPRKKARCTCPCHHKDAPVKAPTPHPDVEK